MDPARVAEAARLFVEARRSGTRLRGLPASCVPATAADANAIVDAVTAQLDETTVGWKIAFMAMPRQVPFLCPMFASRVFASPARVPLSLTPSRRIEPEICFRLTRDFPPRKAAYRMEEIAEAVDACPALEIVDTRFDNELRPIRQMLDTRAGRIEAFADHITTGAYIVGASRSDWRAFDFAAMRAIMRTPSRIIVETVGGHALVDPFLPCVVLINLLRHREGAKTGQILVTGSFSGFFEVSADEPVTAEFDGFGSAQATFVTMA